jgi:serine/threonine protein kinase
VLLTSDLAAAKLADFGLAARTSAQDAAPPAAEPNAPPLAAGGQLVAGTVAYLAPEAYGPLQAGLGAALAAPGHPPSGEQQKNAHVRQGDSSSTTTTQAASVSREGDVYALGVLLGEALTRTRPWQGMRAHEVVW